MKENPHTLFDNLPIITFERNGNYIVKCVELKLVSFSKESEEDAKEKLRIGLNNFLNYHSLNGSLKSMFKKLNISYLFNYK